MKKTVTKIIALCTVGVIIAAGLLSLGLWGYFTDDNRKLTDIQKIEKVLAKTGVNLQENNKSFVESYNKTVEDKLKAQQNGEVSASSYKVEESTDGRYHYADGEDVFDNAVDKINTYLAWYVYFEYFNNFLGSSYLKNTYNVKINLGGTSYGVYAKEVCSYDYMKLFVTTPDEVIGQFDDFEATLYFDEITLEPTSLEFVDKFSNFDEEYSTPYTYTRFICYNFNAQTFDFAEISLPESLKVSALKEKKDSEIFSNIYAATFYHVDFNDYSKFNGCNLYAYGEYQNGKYKHRTLQEAGFPEAKQLSLISKFRNANFSNFDGFSNNFELDEATSYDKGDEAMRYGQNKYRIEKNTETNEAGEEIKYLSIRYVYGIDSVIMNALQEVGEVFDGNFHDFDACDELNFVADDETNYKREIEIDKTLFTEQDYTAIKTWLENEYDENKYYFEEIKISEDLTATISNQEFCIFKNFGTENATLFKISYIFEDTWYFEVKKFSSEGYTSYTLTHEKTAESQMLRIDRRTSSTKLAEILDSSSGYAQIDVVVEYMFYTMTGEEDMNYYLYIENPDPALKATVFITSNTSDPQKYEASSGNHEESIDLSYFRSKYGN